MGLTLPKGVSATASKKNPFRVRAHNGDKLVTVGSFRTIEDAVEAYNAFKGTAKVEKASKNKMDTLIAKVDLLIKEMCELKNRL